MPDFMNLAVASTPSVRQIRSTVILHPYFRLRIFSNT
jgi:hypothetical protein